MERVAGVLGNNRSQAVRIPEGFELPGDEVTIAREADGGRIIRPRLGLEALPRTLDPLDPSDAPCDIPDLDADNVAL